MSYLPRRARGKISGRLSIQDSWHYRLKPRKMLRVSLRRASSVKPQSASIYREARSIRFESPMFEVTLTIHFPDGRTEKLPLKTERLTIGQNNADLLVADPGLANHRASIYRDAQRVWILDEDLLSCSYVNGAPVPRDGRLLTNGDKITIGDYTTIWIAMTQTAIAGANKPKIEMSSPLMWASLVPILIFVILAVALGSRLIDKGDEVKNQRVENREVLVNDNRNTSTPVNQ